MAPNVAHPRVVILGPGLIGGSLALALKEAEASPPVRLWGRTDGFIPAARKAGLEAFTDLPEALESADLLVLCVPVDVMPSLARQTAPLVKSTAWVTDAGSTKRRLVGELEEIFQGRFVGSHPMAGSEKTGFASADARLFQNAPCIVTPTPATRPEALAAVESLWKSVGCEIHRMSPADHDRLVARISHLPHLAASALVHLAAQAGADAQRLSGGGYRDTTRVASGSPGLWTGILSENQEEVVAAIDDLVVFLQETRSSLVGNQSDQLHEFLLRAKTQRDRLISDQHV